MRFEDYSGLKIENLMKNFNIYHVMFKVKNNTIPESFENKFEMLRHYYPTRHSENNFNEPS